MFVRVHDSTVVQLDEPLADFMRLTVITDLYLPYKQYEPEQIALLSVVRLMPAPTYDMFLNIGTMPLEDNVTIESGVCSSYADTESETLPTMHRAKIQDNIF